MPSEFRVACKPDKGTGGRGACKNDNEKPRKNLTVLFCFPITGHVKNKMSVLFVYPRLTKELRACYKVYMGKEITLTFYFLHGPQWENKTTSSNSVFREFLAVPVFLVLVHRCSWF